MYCEVGVDPSHLRRYWKDDLLSHSINKTRQFFDEVFYDIVCVFLINKNETIITLERKHPKYSFLGCLLWSFPVRSKGNWNWNLPKILKVLSLNWIFSALSKVKTKPTQNLHNFSFDFLCFFILSLLICFCNDKIQ